jgi:hypothetical protein
MFSAEEYARHAVREVGRVQGAGGKLGARDQAVIVGVDHGRLTIEANGKVTLDGGMPYQLVKLVVRGIEAAARWRGEQAGRAGRDG